MEQHVHKAGLQKIPLLETLEVSNQGWGCSFSSRLYSGASQKVCSGCDVHWCDGLMLGWGMLHLNQTLAMS